MRIFKIKEYMYFLELEEKEMRLKDAWKLNILSFEYSDFFSSYL